MTGFWDTAGQPIAIAHRGGDGAGIEKENTLAAFAAAAKLGYKYSETDTILTADGQLVVIHGAANLLDGLLKGRRSRRRLQRLSLEQLRQKVSAGGEQIPLLKEVLLAQPKMKFFIDPKTEEAVAPLAELLKKLKATDRVCVGSFNYQRVQRFCELMGRDAPAASFIIGRSLRLWNRNLDMLKTGRLKRVEAVQMHHSLISRQMVVLAQKQGLKVLVWTANSPIAINNAVKCGADGVMSDNLTLLKEIINAKN